jgi:hypothetical protein
MTDSLKCSFKDIRILTIKIIICYGNTMNDIFKHRIFGVSATIKISQWQISAETCSHTSCQSINVT